jgi:uncharacterized membrane protein
MENQNYRTLTPSLGGSFSYAWSKIFGKAFLILLVTVIIVGLLDSPAASVKWNMDDGNFDWPIFFIFPAIIFGLAYTILFVPVIDYGLQYLFLNAMRDEEADIKLLFEGFRSKYLNIVLANLIVTALVIMGFVMLIIPGIIIACRLAFVSYLVMDKNLDPMKAVEKSWQMTKGHGWTIFFMAITSVFLIIFGIVAFIVGVFISIIWIHAAFATLYQSVLNQNDDENPIPILGVNEVR